MKKILITGANSYIGTSFEKYMRQWPENYQVDTVDMLDGTWREKIFSGYDVVLHVAGIAHQKETEENRDLYYRINRDLALDVARKAMQENVPHFIFMSSMSVYGLDQGIITPNIKPAPVSNYGKSKLEAEEGLESFACDAFKVAVIRPPMVYGKNCRGNFQMLMKLVKKSPIFPVVSNRRSMISIRNLCAFLRLIIDRKDSGVFCPQNREYVNTTHMAQLMARETGRNVLFSHLAGFGVRGMIPIVGAARKAFSSLIYQDWEKHDFCYNEENFEESIRGSL